MQARERVAPALMAGLIVLAVGACGPSGAPAADDAATSGASLTMWTFKQSHVDGLRAAAEEYEKQTGTSVTIELTTPQEAYITKIQAAARTDELPDLLTVGSTDEAYKYAAAGVLQDVTERFAEKAEDELLPGLAETAKLTQLAIDNSVADTQSSLEGLTAGHVYGLPYVAGASGIVIARKAALDKAGVDIADAAASWEGFVEAVRATHSISPETGGLVTGMQIPETAYQWLYRPLAYYYLGEEAFQNRDGQAQSPAWTSPESVETLRLYDQVSDLWAPGIFSLGIDQADQAFAQGKAAWDVGGTYTLPFLLQQGMEAEDLVMFPVPAAAGGQIAEAELAATPILSTGVTTQTTDPDAAFDFAEFLSVGDGAHVFSATASEVPASAAAAESLMSDPLFGPVVTALGQSSGSAFNGDDFSALPVGPVEIKHEGAVAIATLVDGKSTPEQVAQQLADLYREAWEQVG